MSRLIDCERWPPVRDSHSSGHKACLAHQKGREGPADRPDPPGSLRAESSAV